MYFFSFKIKNVFFFILFQFEIATALIIKKYSNFEVQLKDIWSNFEIYVDFSLYKLILNFFFFTPSPRFSSLS